MYPFWYVSMIVEQLQFGKLPKVDVQLRKTESPIERRIYYAVTQAGYRAETQVQCGRYRIDVALPDYNVAIEADGKKYHSSKEAKARDRTKDRYLKKKGWTVMRFTGKRIYQDIRGITKEIREATGQKKEGIIYNLFR